MSVAISGTNGITGASQTAKAWANFNGTSSTPITPRSNYNISSVTKNGTGDYTLNFTTAMNDANYSICLTAGGTAGAVARAYDDGTARTTTTCRILSFVASTGTATDFSQMSAQILGN